MTAQLPSRERLEKIASWREMYGSGHNVMLPAEEAEALARFVLAAHEQETVKLTFTTEHRRVIEMLLTVCGAAFELADDSCEQEIDGEMCIAVPSDAFQKLSDALDEIENSLSAEDSDRPDVFLAWSAMPRAALKSLLHPAPVPAVPDYYVVVTTANVWQTFCKTRAEADFIVSKPFHKGYYVLEVYTRRAAMLNGGKS